MEILAFGSADFEDRSWVNSQQLMWRLAAMHRVLYVNSLGLRRPRPTARDLHRVGRRLRAIWAPLSHPAADRQLTVLSPVAPPPTRARVLRLLGRRMLGAQLRRALRQLTFEHPLIYTFLPTAADVIEQLPARGVVYHCVDAYEANPGVDAELVRGMEARLLARADRVVASSMPLFERLRRRHADVRLWPNVVDTDLYPPPGASPPEPALLAPIPRPRIGYVGNLASYKCDLPLLSRAIRSRPEWSWVFIGGIGHGEAAAHGAALHELPGVHWLGERPRAELPALLHHLNVGLIPFRQNETTRHSFPLKFFEYLACGLPVVSAWLPGLAPYLQPPYAFPYENPDQFLPALAQALRAGGMTAARARRALAEAHSWGRRLPEVETLLAGLWEGTTP